MKNNWCNWTISNNVSYFSNPKYFWSILLNKWGNDGIFKEELKEIIFIFIDFYRDEWHLNNRFPLVIRTDFNSNPIYLTQYIRLTIDTTDVEITDQIFSKMKNILEDLHNKLQKYEGLEYTTNKLRLTTGVPFETGPSNSFKETILSGI